MAIANEERLTKRSHWDKYWEDLDLPAVISKKDGTPLLQVEMEILGKYLPRGPLSILEIGGAPGQYLAYFHRQFGYDVSSLDYSPEGCKKTEENFKLLGIDGKVYQEDLFGDLTALPRFDIVFSMGLAEHFEDLSAVVEKHLELLKPGGILFIGMPNFRGINKFFLKRLAPEQLSMHNLDSMEIKRWKHFEHKFNLEKIFKGYIGGFEPMTFMARENDTSHSIWYLTARILNSLFHRRIRFFRKFNSM
ncbi:MAG: class I SAM-dependent methyltransferase, partial [bacterium]